MYHQYGYQFTPAMQFTATVTPDGRVLMLNQLGQVVGELPVQQAAPAAIPQQQQFHAPRAYSQPPVTSQESTISEKVAEEALAQSELTELPTKARSSCPVAEEEVDQTSSPKMTIPISREPTPSVDHAESESGTSEALISEDSFPLTKEVVPPTPTRTTVECEKWIVERRVQVRSGPTASSDKLFILNPGQRVKVVKTKTVRTKGRFLATKAYILADGGQGWVSVNRPYKKTTETFVFRGKANATLKRMIQEEPVWARHEASVEEIRNTTGGALHVRVSCPTWEKTESLRKDLRRNRLFGKSLVNQRTPKQLINLKRVYGNSVPTVHVFDINTDADFGHATFRGHFDFSNQFRGSLKDFAHQVKNELSGQLYNFKGVRRVSWDAGHTSQGNFSMRDYCTLEFSQHANLLKFLKNYEAYPFFQGASVKVDPIYANLETVKAEMVEA